MKQFLTSASHLVIAGSLLLSSQTFAGGEAAYVQEEADRLVYTLEYFSEYDPITALDMVNQIPGFQLQGNHGQGRGFGQGKGNLLINGKRPSTKDVDGGTLLGRIPAANVEKIELLTEGSAELAGQTSLIVNVVVKNTEKMSGQWKIGGRYEQRGHFFPTGSVSLNGQEGQLSFSASLELSIHARVNEGPEYIYDQDRVLTELRDERSDFAGKNWSLTTGLGYDFAGGQHLNLNFKGERWIGDTYERSDRFLPDAQDGFGDYLRQSYYDENEREYNYEVGADYSMAMGPGDWKLIFLRRMEDSKYDSLYREVEANDDLYQFNSIWNPLETETILRSLYSFEPVAGHNFEWAIEAVKNGLDKSASYEETDALGLFVPVEVDGSNRVVTEERGESSLLYSRSFNEEWSLQSTLAIEYSKILVKGLEDQARSYWRPKGFVALTYNMAKDTTVRSRVERTVGQLNFNIFAASLNLTEGQADASNVNIKPDQTWTGKFEIEHRFGDKNIVSFESFYSYVNDYIAKIPLGDGTEADGNVKSAQKWGGRVNITYVVDELIPGGRIDYYARLWDSRVRDPLSGEIRSMDNFQCCGNSFRFRQDVPNSNIAWGFQINHGSGRKYHRIDNITKVKNSAPDYYLAWVQHNDIFGMKGEVKITMPFGRTTTQTREYYSPDRLSDFIGYEQRFRDTGFDLRFSLTKNF